MAAEQVNAANKTIADIFKDALAYTNTRVQEYNLNYAYLKGNQWLYWSEQNKRLETRDVNLAFDDRLRAVFNKVRANQRVLMSNMTQRPIVFEVIPDKADTESMEAARTGEGYLQYLHKSQNLEVRREEFLQAVALGGVGAMCVDWNEDTNEPDITPLTITEFIIQPGARVAETALWWIKLQHLPPETVKSMFKMSELPDADATSADYDTTWLSKQFDQSTRGVNSRPPLVKVYTYYERPHKDQPKGRVVIEVNEKQVFRDDWYFPFKDRLNIDVARETIETNVWWGSSYMDDVRRVQAALNSAWTVSLEHLRNMGNMREYVPQQLWETMQAIEPVPGMQIPIPDGMELPKYSDFPNPGAWLDNLIERCGMFIDDLMAVHDPSRGVAPPNIESGLGIQILTERDSSPATRMIKETKRVFENIASKCLMLQEKLGKAEKKKIRVDVGWDFEVIDFEGKNINGQYDVHIPIDQIMPRSRAAQQQMAGSMLQMGLVQGLDAFLTLSEYPGAKNMIAVMLPDLAKARREIRAFVKGLAAQPADFDDHVIHIAEHERFLKSQRFELMENKDQELIIDHIQTHKNMLAAQQAEDMQMQGAQQAAAEGLGLSAPIQPELPGMGEGGIAPQAELSSTYPEGGESISSPEIEQLLADLEGGV